MNTEQRVLSNFNKFKEVQSKKKQNLGIIQDAVFEQKLQFLERVGKLKQYMDDMAVADSDLTEALNNIEPLKNNFLELYSEFSRQITEYDALSEMADELDNFNVETGPDWMMIYDLFESVLVDSNETKNRIV